MPFNTRTDKFSAFVHFLPLDFYIQTLRVLTKEQNVGHLILILKYPPPHKDWHNFLTLPVSFHGRSETKGVGRRGPCVPLAIGCAAPLLTSTGFLRQQWSSKARNPKGVRCPPPGTGVGQAMQRVPPSAFSEGWHHHLHEFMGTLNASRYPGTTNSSYTAWTRSGTYPQYSCVLWMIIYIR